MSDTFLVHNNDSVSVSPQLHIILFENEAVRMVKLIIPPAAKAAMHWHPKSVSYVISGGKVRRTKPTGKTTDSILNAGAVNDSPERLHAVENIGDSTVEIIEVEFKI